jgi:hypothetical protein
MQEGERIKQDQEKRADPPGEIAETWLQICSAMERWWSDGNRERERGFLCPKNLVNRLVVD